MAYLPPETRLLHSLLRLHGHSTDGFSARLLPDGSVRVIGPRSATFYPAPAWTSHFLRHLRYGFFDPACAVSGRAFS